MSFEQFWSSLQGTLRPGVSVATWSALRGELGGSFSVVEIYPNRVSIDAPDAENIQSVPKRDFKAIYEIWPAYLNGELQRQHLTPLTRFSTYIISIFHLLDDAAITR